jgi:hypothetical protein
MALLKKVNTPYGVDANYWNIYSISENFKQKLLDVTIVGYASKEVREKDMHPVGWIELTFAGDDYIKDATREAIYLALKTKDFADSKDC